jgi:hypothetical protein
MTTQAPVDSSRYTATLNPPHQRPSSDGQPGSNRFFRRISTDKRACVQRTITVYRLARNGLQGDVAARSQRSGERRAHLLEEDF